MAQVLHKKSISIKVPLRSLLSLTVSHDKLELLSKWRGKSFHFLSFFLILGLMRGKKLVWEFIPKVSVNT